MKTLVIQIGNSDDKLTQMEWSEFVDSIGTIIQGSRSDVHFQGYSPEGVSWQNACWVIAVHDDFSNGLGHKDHMDRLLQSLSNCGKKFKQDSIAILIGDTKFI